MIIHVISQKETFDMRFDFKKYDIHFKLLDIELFITCLEKYLGYC